MSNSANTVLVEVRSETTGKSVIKFETNEPKEARKTAYERIAKFLNIDKSIATLNYFVDITA